MTLTCIRVQNTGIDTYKCQIRYTCRFVNFVCAQHRYFAREAHQARKDENIDFDLTCDVISDLKVKWLTLFGEFTSRAIEWRLKSGNRSSSLENLGGGLYPPPIRTYCQPDPIGARVKDIGFLSPFLHKNRTDFNNTTCYPCLPSTIYFYRDSVSAVVTTRLLYVCQTKRFPKFGLKC